MLRSYSVGSRLCGSDLCRPHHAIPDGYLGRLLHEFTPPAVPLLAAYSGLPLNGTDRYGRFEPKQIPIQSTS
jgi:hypothetical protein